MTAYRRNLVAGGTYFFTLNLADRRSPLLTDNIGLLRAAFRYTRHRHPFAIDAIAILPDHLHALWPLPVGDSDFSTHWRLIKTTFSRGLQSDGQKLDFFVCVNYFTSSAALTLSY